MDLEPKPTINFAVLRCNVQEEDLAKKESCTLHWDDLIMESHLEERMTLSERDMVLKEGYEKRQQTIFLVQRSPLQTIRVGRLGGDMRHYQLPHKTLLPVPLFTPRLVQAQDQVLPQDHKALQTSMKMLQSNGLCVGKRDIVGLVSDLPQVMQPAKMQLRVSSLISPPPVLHDTTWH
ncbi:telethonin-like [Rhinophrynus dorsalis]